MNEYGNDGGYGYNNHQPEGDSHGLSEEEEFNRLLAEENSSEESSDGLGDLLGADTSEEEETDSQDTSEADSEGALSDTDLNEIKDKFETVPRNVTNEPVFSEKDVFLVINTRIVLDEIPEEDEKWVDYLFSVGGNNVRRAMNLVKMDKVDFEEKREPIQTLNEILSDAAGGEGADAFTLVFDIISKVQSLSEQSRANMLNQLRRLGKEQKKAVKVSSTKSSPDVDVARELVSIAQGNPEVLERIEFLGTLVDSLAETTR